MRARSREASRPWALGLADPSPNVRGWALAALAKMGPEAAPAAEAVRGRLQDEDRNGRAWAAKALRAIQGR
ncbi:MAG: HEAT repeat domain-containing protein [Planctomycetes bacterium]|nr:HEAT repeat domain-containing protein [Planctomycetota bacterium]